MKKPNVDWIKVAGIAGTLLGVAATALSGWSSQKATKDEISKQVEEALKNRK